MTLLSIIQNACTEIGLPRPTAVISNSDDQVISLLQHCNREGRELARDHDWTVLQRLHTITTVASQAEYALPDDFARVIRDTEWDRAQRRPMFGASSPQVWQEIKSSLIGSGVIGTRYRIYRSQSSTSRKIYLDPTPSANGDTLTFEYVSANWCSDSAGATPASAWAADTDVTLFDEDLVTLGVVIRFKRQKGFDFASEADEYMQLVETLTSQDRPAKTLYLHNRRGIPFLSHLNLPDTGYGS